MSTKSKLKVSRKGPLGTDKPRKVSQNPPPTRSRVGISSSSISSSNMSMKSSSGVDPRLGEWYRLTGSEFISTISQPANTDPGDILFSRMNDVAPPNTRLAQLAALYERWEPISYEYRFISSSPTSTAGSLLGAIDPDPCRVYSDTTDNLVALRVLRGSCLQQVWNNFSIRLPSERDYTTLWCDPATTILHDPEDRLSTAGQILIASSVPTGTSGAVLGQLELHYDIKFYLPRIRVNATNSSFDMKIPINTDSGGFFEGVPINTYVPLLGTLLEKARTTITQAGSAALDPEFLRLLRTFSKWGATVPESQSIFRKKLESNSVESLGLPHGIYRLTLTNVSNTAADASANRFNCSDHYGANSSTFAGQEQIGGLNTQACLQFDGVSYAYSRSMCLEFRVDSGESRGFVDIPCRWSEASTGIYMFANFSWYTPGSYKSSWTTSVPSYVGESSVKKSVHRYRSITPYLPGYGSERNCILKGLKAERLLESKAELKEASREVSYEDGEDVPLIISPTPVSSIRTPILGTARVGSSVQAGTKR